MSPAPRAPLPIDEALPALRDALRGRPCAVLVAPPGAGKTTRVPLALLHEPWLAGQRIVMLEPRRLAARAAARRMAHELGESVGDTVGYRVRGDARTGSRTRIEVVTEGILTRLLVRDPALDGIGAVLFDEFHERSLVGDTGLALALQAQELLRPELRLLVMSATLDGDAVAALLDGAPVVRSEGRMHPVERRWLPRRDDVRVEGAVASAVRRALAEHSGSVLAFLPGGAEIRRTRELLLDAGLPLGVTVHPLHGDLPPAEQDAAIAPAPPGARKVVLATSIAETSLTIEGVTVVVDAGLARVPRFSPRSGMTRLETVRVSRAAADQRAGRAGRTSPGVCYRLWSEQEDAALAVRAVPEVLEADLAPLALDLAAAGIAAPGELRWLDAPPAGAFAQARALLGELGALDADARLTAHGRAMSELGTHPRLAHMLLSARAHGLGTAAAYIAALLDERDLLPRDPSARDADVRSRLALAAPGTRADRAERADRPDRVDRGALVRVREQARRWCAQLGVGTDEPVDPDDAGLLVALAYPDRVAQRRPGAAPRYVLRGGNGAMLSDGDALVREPWLAVAELDGRPPESRIWLAAPIARATVDALFAGQVIADDVVAWDDASGAVTALRRERLGAIVLRERPLRDVPDDAVTALLLEAIRRGSLALPWSDAARRTRERLAFVRTLDPEWPDVSDDTLLASLDEWLAPHLPGVRRRAALSALDLGGMLLDLLGWERRRLLDELAPTHLEVPTGSRLPVDYADPLAPTIAVRLQELFGLADGPRVGGGRVPVVLQLLSPAHRPVQVTRDLAGFWASSYHEVRRELRGRYPRHAWPERPMEAEPTRRARPRR